VTKPATEGLRREAIHFVWNCMLERKQESYLACLVISATEQEVTQSASVARLTDSVLLGVVGTEQLYI